MKGDLVFGGATLALSAGYYWMASGIPESQLADAIGPQGLPKTYAVLLAALSLILIVRSVAQRQRWHRTSALSAPRTTEAAGQRRVLWRVAGMLAMGVVYVVVVPWLGYIPSLAALIFATTYYQGGAVNRQVAVVALSGALFFWLLFVMLMGIPQPPGFWPSLL